MNWFDPYGSVMRPIAHPPWVRTGAPCRLIRLVAPGFPAILAVRLNEYHEPD
jgi:hypothetical protein